MNVLEYIEEMLDQGMSEEDAERSAAMYLDYVDDGYYGD